MKKVYVALAILTTALLVSCEREQSFDDLTPIGENGIAFAINGAETRSGETAIPTQKGAIISLEKSLFLEETIMDLNPTPATKGTPAYTANVGVLYKTMFVHAVGGEFGDATFDVMDMYEHIGTPNDPNAPKDEGKENGNGWRYHHNFDANPWPGDNDVEFYLSMPAEISGIDDGPTYDGGTISFTYSSAELTTAADQQDILFSYTKLKKSVHDGYLPYGAPVLMYHALTGVKFAIENYSSEEKISIKEVSFKGLSDTGDCTITSAGVVTWDPGSPSNIEYKSGTFEGSPVDFDSGSFKNNGDYPESFSAAGNKNNLNDEDATQTFWFVPQVVPVNATLTIKYTYGSDTVKEGKIPFGQVLNGVEWKAGQLRTYTIRVDDVNVMIEDEVDMKDATYESVTDDHGNTFDALSYRGSKKENVVITNTGNTDAYIRAAIIGQWLDEDGNPVFGFTDYTTQDVSLVSSWYEDQFVLPASQGRKHGKFEGLVGYDSDYSGDWILGSDGYYYYPNIVKAGESIPEDDPLFTSYTVLAPPAVKVAGGVKNVYFQLEIATQAISAKKIDGSTWATYSAAWANAKAQ